MEAKEREAEKERLKNLSDEDLGVPPVEEKSEAEQAKEDSSQLFVDVFKGLEKCRWSMTNIQMGSLLNMKVRPELPETEQISTAHNLRDNLRTYSEGLQQATNGMARLCEAMEKAGVNLDALKAELQKSSKFEDPEAPKVKLN